MTTRANVESAVNGKKKNTYLRGGDTLTLEAGVRTVAIVD